MTDTTAGEGGLAAQLRRRLEDLKGQFEKGRARLGQLEAEAGELRQTLTRIAGAIQVLEEELGRHDGGPGQPPAGP
jgi:predicted nuclease with TOPRIM domain